MYQTKYTRPPGAADITLGYSRGKVLGRKFFERRLLLALFQLGKVHAVFWEILKAAHSRFAGYSSNARDVALRQGSTNLRTIRPCTGKLLVLRVILSYIYGLESMQCSLMLE